MTVYVVFKNEGYGNGVIVRVYGTKERAQEDIDLLLCQHVGDYELLEYEVR